MADPDDAGRDRASTSGDGPAAPTPPTTGRSLRDIASGFWYQKPGPRAPRDRPALTKEIVNGLDQREYLYGWVASGLAILTGIVLLVAENHSTSAKNHNDPWVVFASFLVGWLCMVAGTAFRRRALLGFASFLIGLEMLSYFGGLIGLIWLAFGFWLISRVMRKQRNDRDARNATAAKAPAARRASTPPKASKRYTPPRSRSTSARRR